MSALFPGKAKGAAPPEPTDPPYTVGERLKRVPWAVRHEARSEDGRPLVLAFLDADVRGDIRPQVYSSAVAQMIQLGDNEASFARTVRGGVALDGTWWLATEGPAGPSLRQIVEENGPLYPARFYPVAVAVARALTTLGSLQMAHGVLTPDCVRVNQETGDVIVEWCRMRRILATSILSRGPGMAPYLAPRLLKRDHIRDDVYSYARLLLFMIAGESLVRRRRSHVLWRLSMRSGGLPDIDRDLRRLISKCLRRWAWTRPRPYAVLDQVRLLETRHRQLEEEAGGHLDALTPLKELDRALSRKADPEDHDQSGPPGSPDTSSASHVDEGPGASEAAKLFLSTELEMVDALPALENSCRNDLPVAEVSKRSPTPAEVHRPTPPWVFPTEGMIDAPVAVVGSRVYAASMDGRLYALNLRSGTGEWEYATEGPILSAPLTLDQTVIVASTDGYVHAVTASDGELVWQIEIGPIGASDPVALADGLHFVGADGEVVSVWLGAREVSKFPVGDAMASSLAVSDGLLIVGALSGLNALRPTDGMLTHIWRYDEADFSGCAPAVVGGVVFSGGDVRGRTAVHAVDASDGGYIWKRQTHGLVSGRPAADSKLLYAADDEGYLTAFDLRSGEPHWAIPHHAPILGGPALRDGQVYVGGRNRYLHAYNAADGTELWSIPTKGWINRSAPVMADGLVIVGSADGYVHAVSTRGERIEVSPQQVDVRFNL